MREGQVVIQACGHRLLVILSLLGSKSFQTLFLDQQFPLQRPQPPQDKALLYRGAN